MVGNVWVGTDCTKLRKGVFGFSFRPFLGFVRDFLKVVDRPVGILTHVEG